MAATKNSQRGQGVTELLVALPLLIALVAGLGLIFARGVLRLELQTLTQELKVCYASTHSRERCRDRFARSLARFPGAFRVVRVDHWGRNFEVTLRHQLPLPPRQWTFNVPQR